MALQGLIQDGHMPTNKYSLKIIGMPDLTITKISGLEETLEVAEMPDRTMQSSGQTEAMEWTMEIPLHHALEQAAMELWYSQGKDPVAADFEKSATLVHLSSKDGVLPRSFSMTGVFPKGRKLPDLDMSEKGETTFVVWTMNANEVTPI